MRKKHHTLLAAVIVIAIAVCIGSASEARVFRSQPTSTLRVLKPGARITSGEPDAGGGRSQNGGTGGGFVPSPSGFGFVVPVWVTRFVGAGW
jgi:hypothetical protein